VKTALKSVDFDKVTDNISWILFMAGGVEHTGTVLKVL